MDVTHRRAELPYSPGLDGMRAFAVLAVIAFHNGFTWLLGGYYGVDVFFVLSGYLITSLLLAEWQGAGTVRLGAFWARRARRLLPAVLVLVLVIGVVAAVWPASFDATNLFTQSLATVGYSANWYYATTHVTYFTASAAPSPLLHTWSLAIEEQFYLVWPLVVLTVVGGWRRRGRRRGGFDAAGGTGDGEAHRGSAAGLDSDAWRRGRLRLLLYISVFGAAASAILMAAVSSEANGINRAYYGTDTRAQGLLVGAALATAFTLWGHGRARSGVGWAAIGLVGAGAVAVMWVRVPQGSWLAFHGGFLLVSISCAAVVASVIKAPAGVVPRLLATWPLRSLGRISYGVYLWYWPVLLVVSQQRTGLGLWPLFAWRVAITVALAAISYVLVEQPIRRGVLPWRRALVVAPLAAGLAFGVAALGTSVAAAALVRPGSALASDTVAARGGDAAGLVASGGQEVKVLLVGDSMAGTLGVGLASQAPRYGMQLMNDGTPQCSLSMDQEFQVLWYRLTPAPPCKPGDPDALFQRWQQIVDAYNPDVVVYLGRGEQFDQEVDSRWGHLGQRWFDGWVASRFRRAVGVLGSARCRGRAHAAAGVGLRRIDAPRRGGGPARACDDRFDHHRRHRRPGRGGGRPDGPGRPGGHVPFDPGALRRGPRPGGPFVGHDVRSGLAVEPGRPLHQLDRWHPHALFRRCALHHGGRAGRGYQTLSGAGLARSPAPRHQPQGSLARHPAPGRPLVDQRAQLLSPPMGARPGAEAAPEDGTTSGPEDGTSSGRDQILSRPSQ